MSRLVVGALLGALALSVAACGGAEEPPAATPTPAADPLGGRSLYVDPVSPAALEAAEAEGEGRYAEADDFATIAAQPVATWFSGQQADPYAAAEELTSAAAEADQLPVLVVYNRPQRDCGQFSAGGASDAQAYYDWLGALSAGIGGRPALVVLEPDAVSHALQGCGTGESPESTYALLTTAVDILGEQARTQVFVDAGHAGWVEDLEELAQALRESGATRAAGFALNTSNFQSTEDSLAYGERLSALLDGAPYVVDTSRNGNGAPAGVDDGDVDAWCNPPGRALGDSPTTATGSPSAVAFLWVKQPGNSDGACRDGEPEAGAWWPEYARELVRNRHGAAASSAHQVSG